MSVKRTTGIPPPLRTGGPSACWTCKEGTFRNKNPAHCSEPLFKGPPHRLAEEAGLGAPTISGVSGQRHQLTPGMVRAVRPWLTVRAVRPWLWPWLQC